MLDVVEQALLANNLSYIRPASKKKFGSEISRFQSSTSSNSLLMNVKQGAEGLNLTEVSVLDYLILLDFSYLTLISNTRQSTFSFWSH